MKNTLTTDKARFLEWIQELDSKITGKATVLAVGGTACTLLGLKNATKDIDLLIPESKEFNKLKEIFIALGYENFKTGRWRTPDGLIIDLYEGNYIFATSLDDDFLEKSIPIKEFKHISLKAINPYDIIISKLSRSSPADLEDIKAVMEKEKIDLDYLTERYIRSMQWSHSLDPKYNLLRLFRKDFAEWEIKVDKKLMEKIENDERI